MTYALLAAKGLRAVSVGEGGTAFRKARRVMYVMPDSPPTRREQLIPHADIIGSTVCLPPRSVSRLARWLKRHACLQDSHHANPRHTPYSTLSRGLFSH